MNEPSGKRAAWTERKAELRRQLADMARLTAKTQEQLATALEHIAQARPAPDAERLRANAQKARDYAASELDQATSYDQPQESPRS